MKDRRQEERGAPDSPARSEGGAVSAPNGPGAELGEVAGERWRPVGAVGLERHTARPAAVELAGSFERLDNPSLFGLADALLKTPANVVRELNHSRASMARFMVLVLACTLLIGIVVASFSGGYQYLAVPLKLAVGFFFGAALCLPSLYVFSCLSGSRHSLQNVAAAQLMGMGVQALLLIGFAPIAWVFSQSTNSVAFMGFLYLIMLLVSAGFGLGLTAKVLAVTGRRARALWLWNMIVVVVSLQLATNLRPLVGEFDGLRLQEKQFFLTHWFKSLDADFEGDTRNAEYTP